MIIGTTSTFIGNGACVVQNHGPDNLYFGEVGVSVTTGVRIRAGEAVALSGGRQFFAVSSGTSDARSLGRARGLSALGIPTSSGPILHGKDVTRTNVGCLPGVSRTTVAAIDVTTSGTVYENLTVMGGFDVKGKIGIVLNNVQIIGNTVVANAGYTLKNSTAGGQVDGTNVEVICRAANTKAVAMNNTGSIRLTDSIIRGGEDGVFINPAAGPRNFEGYQGVLRRCLVTDQMELGGNHGDAFQSEGGTGGILLDTCKFDSHTLAEGLDPLTNQHDGTSRGNAAVIFSQNGASPTAGDNAHILNSWLEGGNYSGRSDEENWTNVVWEGNQFGLDSQFGPLLYDLVGSTLINNTWGATGITPLGPVTIGDPVT